MSPTYILFSKGCGTVGGTSSNITQSKQSTTPHQASQKSTPHYGLLVVSTALPAARSSTTRHFEVLDFLGFDLCMRIKQEMCLFGAVLVPFWWRTGFDLCFGQSRWGGGDSHFSIHVPLLHAQVELWMHLLMEDVVVIDRFLALLFAIEVDEAHNPQHQQRWCLILRSDQSSFGFFLSADIPKSVSSCLLMQLLLL